MIEKIEHNKLYLVPLGGCGQFGMNCTLYIYEGHVWVVDVGLMFPDPTKLGVDAIIPNPDPWFEVFGAPTAYLITHGHEDHCGAVPFFYRKWPAPIFATPWTAELLREKFFYEDLTTKPHITVVKPLTQVTIGALKAQWIPVTHSIPESCSLALSFQDQYRVFHTGDFKLDKNPIYEKPTAVEAIKSFASQSVDLLLADSTNAHKAGRCLGEGAVKDPLKKVISQARGLSYVTTFSSNLWRIKTLLGIATELDKKICFVGRGLERVIVMAKKLGYLDTHDLWPVINEQQALKEAQRSQLIVVATGCQAEPRAALSRIVRGEHKIFKIEPDDQIIFSSRIIPGNEKLIGHLTSQALKQGAEVITPLTHPFIHVSGHGFQEDLEEMFQLVQPHWLIPVHGTYSHLHAHGQHFHEHAVVPPESGDVLCYDGQHLSFVEHFEIEWLYVDAYSKDLLGREELNQRLKIGDTGLVVVHGVYSCRKQAWMNDLHFSFWGIQEPDSATGLQEVRQTIDAFIHNWSFDDQYNTDTLNEQIRILTRRWLKKVYNKKIVTQVYVHYIDG